MKILLPIDGSKTSLSATKYVAQLVGNMRSKCSVTLINVHDDFGLVSKEILETATKEKFDMIVMGAKGRGGVLDLLIGSVAQRVVSSAKQPVLLVK